MQQHGPGIMNGDQNALSAYAQYDAPAALGVQQTRQSMDESRQMLDMAYQASARQATLFARQMDEATLARERETVDRAAAMLTQAQTAEQFKQVLQIPGATEAIEGLLGRGMATFENRDMIIAVTLGARHALEQGRPEFRAATPEEAASYGAANGQIGRDGRFYPINPPTGMTIEQTSDGGLRMVQGPGAGSSRAATAAVAAEENRQATAATVLADIDRILDLESGGGVPVTGPMGRVSSFIPGTNAHDVAALLDTISANIAFDSLSRMRAASPTGGALGAISERELALLQATSGSLQQSQSPEQFRRNLERLRQQFYEVIHGPAMAQPAPQQQPQNIPNAAIQSSYPTPSNEAIQFLRSDPTPEAIEEFNVLFGEGAAQTALRGQ